jgi:hypothetical protein
MARVYGGLSGALKNAALCSQHLDSTEFKHTEYNLDA